MLAEWETDHDTPPLCLSGHLDTVPLGAAAWSHDPFAGQLDGDRLYGRGTSDMKGGIAALVLAAIQATATRRPRRAGLRLVLTAAEETGAHGARHLLPQLRTRPSGPLLIAEPTANEVYRPRARSGSNNNQRRHSTRLHPATRRQRHPETRPRDHSTRRLRLRHAEPSAMGTPTLNVGTFHAEYEPQLGSRSGDGHPRHPHHRRPTPQRDHRPARQTRRKRDHAGTSRPTTSLDEPHDPWAKSVAAITGTVGRAPLRNVLHRRGLPRARPRQRTHRHMRARNNPRTRPRHRPMVLRNQTART